MPSVYLYKLVGSDAFKITTARSPSSRYELYCVGSIEVTRPQYVCEKIKRLLGQYKDKIGLYKVPIEQVADVFGCFGQFRESRTV